MRRACHVAPRSHQHPLNSHVTSFPCRAPGYSRLPRASAAPALQICPAPAPARLVPVSSHVEYRGPGCCACWVLCSRACSLISRVLCFPGHRHARALGYSSLSHASVCPCMSRHRSLGPGCSACPLVLPCAMLASCHAHVPGYPSLPRACAASARQSSSWCAISWSRCARP